MRLLKVVFLLHCTIGKQVQNIANKWKETEKKQSWTPNDSKAIKVYQTKKCL